MSNCTCLLRAEDFDGVPVQHHNEMVAWERQRCPEHGLPVNERATCPECGCVYVHKPMPDPRNVLAKDAYKAGVRPSDSAYRLWCCAACRGRLIRRAYVDVTWPDERSEIWPEQYDFTPSRWVHQHRFHHDHLVDRYTPRQRFVQGALL